MKPIERRTLLRHVMRGGALVGLAALCGTLARREEKFECSDRCGSCPRFEHGKCGLGLR